MTNIDIITLTGLTAVDGSILDTGAIIKFETEFPIGFAGFHARIKAYRNRAIFEAGYDGIYLHGIKDELIEDMGVEFFNLTPTLLYTKVAEYINNHYEAIVCEVEITN
jgi:hypothetical protein